MRPTALLERYRMALEVIANGPSFEPGTRTARMALTPPEVSAERAKHPLVRVPALEQPESDGLSVREAVERARAEEMAHEVSDDEMDEWEETTQEPDEPDDEPEPIDLAEIDEELDGEEEPEAEEKPKRTIEKRGRDGLLPTEAKILEWIRDVGEVTPEQVRIKFALAKENQKRYAKTLIERGLIVGIGERAGRVYRSAGRHSEHREATEAGKSLAAATERERIDAVVAKASQDKPTMPAQPASEKVADAGSRAGAYDPAGLVADAAEVKRNGVGSDEGRLLESVRFKPNWSIAQHAGRLDLHQDRVSRAMRKLEEEGEVRSSPHGGRVAWNVR